MIRPICLLLLAFTFSSMLEAQSPWSKVPPLPTGCYTHSDTPDTNIPAAIDDLREDDGRQETVNRDLRNQLRGLDQAARSQLMMNLMMKDPEGAKEFITGMVEGSQLTTDATQAHLDRMKAFQDELNELMANFATKAQVVDKLFDSVPRYDPGGPSVSKAETEAALAKANGAYMASCKTDLFEGPMIPFLGRVRAYLEDDNPYVAATINGTKFEKMQLEGMGVDATAFRPEEEIEVVVEYLEFADQVFGLRRAAPQVY